MFVRAFLLVLLCLVLLAFVLPVVSPDAIPQIVEQVREIVGPQPIAFAEDVFYAALDRYNQWAYQGKTTPGYWQTAPTSSPTNDPLSRSRAGLQRSLNRIFTTVRDDISTLSTKTNPTVTTYAGGSSSQGFPGLPALKGTVGSFHPANIAPLYRALAAAGEGEWSPLPSPFDGAGSPIMYKTFLHPDPQRSYARIAIVAIDATRVRLHTVVGTKEPVSSVPVPRPGLVPQADLPALVAAFNGGFRAIHGAYGMMVNGQVLLPPKNYGDTIALYHDGGIRIAPWSVISNTLASMDAYRQTPPYLAYNGQVNPALDDEASMVWGATVTRVTVIWRSAIGLSADGRTLYYGAGESLTARRLAEAMVAAGASHVAELDVNLSYERFLTYDPTHAAFDGVSLLPAMATQPKLYTAKPADRDFFYLTLAH